MFRSLNIMREGLAVIEKFADFLSLYRDALQWLPDAQKSQLRFDDLAPSELVCALRTTFSHGETLPEYHCNTFENIQ
jgi:hypothetical protein